MESKNQRIVKVPENIGTMTPEERRKVAEQIWENLSSKLAESRQRDPNLQALDEILDSRTNKD